MNSPTILSSESDPVPVTQPATLSGSGGHSAVTFTGVSRSFGQVRALDNVDLVIQLGSTIALLGPNGAGKSTAIGLMLGLLEPDTGMVRTLEVKPNSAVRSGRVGAMLQPGGLPSGARVGEVVDLARRLSPRPLSLDAVLKSAGLAALSGRLTEALREGVTNVMRHSHARNCTIRIGRDESAVYAEIVDDGSGSVPTDQRGEGSGLRGLAERVSGLGGRLVAGPLSEGGYRLRVTLPNSATVRP
ncbi:MAG: ATP-binding cassette domain-containing protein [Candidatus Limnocylindrales bacterium]